MSDLRDRIKEVMQEHGLKTNAEMAKWAGVSRGLVGQWLAGLTPFGKKPMLHIDDKTHFNVAWIATGEGAKYKKDKIKNNPQQDANFGDVGSFVLWSSNDPLDPDEFVDVPFYKDLEFAAGNGRCGLPETEFKLPFAKSTLYSAGVPLNAAICATLHGSSQEPVMPHGTTVGIDTSDTTVSDGEMYAFDQGDMRRIKMLYRIPGGYRIVSYNKEEFPDETAALEDVCIIGRVFTWSVMPRRRRR